MRKPFLRERMILKLKPKYEEGTKTIAVMNLKGGVGGMEAVGKAAEAFYRGTESPIRLSEGRPAPRL
ncbi:MAG: hypothetical protein V1875_09675 [Candidatus Altiarchaeota archaeon]